MALIFHSVAAAVTVCALLTTSVVHAQDYPTRAVTIIVPTGPGGGTDIIARLIGAQLAQQLDQPFVIDNRPGAGLPVGTAAAVTTKARSQVLPDVPTVAETVPGFEYHTWFGLWAPRKTPRAIVEKLNAEIGKALSTPAVTASIRGAAGEPATMPLADIEPFVAAEISKWADVIKRAGVKVD